MREFLKGMPAGQDEICLAFKLIRYRMHRSWLTGRSSPVRELQKYNRRGNCFPWLRLLEAAMNCVRLHICHAWARDQEADKEPGEKGVKP